ncbi:MAG: TIM barrel protein [Bryobacteraceae bacterium]|jgi:sugar phosphate isomerase/epimerase
MPFTRRQALALTASALAAQDRNADGPRPRALPAICLDSEALVKIGYDEMGGLLGMMGFDGAAIAVAPGAHVTPEHADLDLMRFVEALTGVGLDAVAIATPQSFSPQDRTVRLSMAVAGMMGVPLFVPGRPKSPATMPRELALLASIARQTGTAVGLGPEIVAALTAGAGTAAGVDPLARLDAKVVGYVFDPADTAARSGGDGCLAGLRASLPRLKMITARDYAKPTGGDARLRPARLGQGMVDWPGVLAVLAQVKYRGPITIYVDAASTDSLPAIRADLAFLKQALTEAYRA